MPSRGDSQCLHPRVVADLADSDNEDCPFKDCSNEEPVTMVTDMGRNMHLSVLLLPACTEALPDWASHKTLVCLHMLLLEALKQ